LSHVFVCCISQLNVHNDVEMPEVHLMLNILVRVRLWARWMTGDKGGFMKILLSSKT